MTATNMCSNFGGKWDSPPFLIVRANKELNSRSVIVGASRSLIVGA